MAAEPPQFRIELRQDLERDILVLAGVVDQSAALPLHAEATRLACGSKPVAIDWREAERVGAPALQVLLGLRSVLAARGLAFEVACDQPDVRHSLETAGLASYFPMEASPWKST